MPINYTQPGRAPVGNAMLDFSQLNEGIETIGGVIKERRDDKAIKGIKESFDKGEIGSQEKYEQISAIDKNLAKSIMEIAKYGDLEQKRTALSLLNIVGKVSGDFIQNKYPPEVAHEKWKGYRDGIQKQKGSKDLLDAWDKLWSVNKLGLPDLSDSALGDIIAKSKLSVDALYGSDTKEAATTANKRKVDIAKTKAETDAAAAKLLAENKAIAKEKERLARISAANALSEIRAGKETPEWEKIVNDTADIIKYYGALKKGYPPPGVFEKINLNIDIHSEAVNNIYAEIDAIRDERSNPGQNIIDTPPVDDDQSLLDKIGGWFSGDSASGTDNPPAPTSTNSSVMERLTQSVARQNANAANVNGKPFNENVPVTQQGRPQAQTSMQPQAQPSVQPQAQPSVPAQEAIAQAQQNPQFQNAIVEFSKTLPQDPQQAIPFIEEQLSMAQQGIQSGTLQEKESLGFAVKVMKFMLMIYKQSASQSMNPNLSP